jgi:energy-coupling factor transporter ATP-binding protein EcfA2
MNGAILGFTEERMQALYQRIEDFAEIGPFIDQPVKTYSSGMVVRLAFSVAIHTEPDILIVDEALAVGDLYFRQRCLRKVHELRNQGVTILFVSHSTGDVKAIGDRALWLQAGRMRELGSTDKVVTRYLAAMVEKDSAYLELKKPAPHEERSAESAPEVVRDIPNIDHRYGDGRAEVLGIAVLDKYGRRIAVLEPDTEVVIRISVQAKDHLALPNVGFMIRNHLGVDFAGTNTTREGISMPSMQPGDISTVDFHLQIPTLYPAAFSFSPAVADGSLLHYKMCDWIDNAISLQMARAEGQVYVFLHLPCRVELNGRLQRPDAPKEAFVD